MAGATQQLKTPVAIVGGGPVGLVLALLLDHYGVRCTLINTEPTERWHPKGNGHNARTMEIYRQLAFSDEVRHLGLPRDHPFDQAYFTRLSTHEIYRFPMPTGEERIAMRRDMPVTDQLPEPTDARRALSPAEGPRRRERRHALAGKRNGSPRTKWPCASTRARSAPTKTWCGPP